MSKRNVQELAALFRIAGARDPEGWARSEVDEGIPQLARFLFLRQAWRAVLSEGDATWIGALMASAKRDPHAPGSGSGPALERLLAAGADPADLTEVVRSAQWELLFRLCYLLDDPSIVEPELGHVAWQLFEVDDNERPVRPIGGLYESVLETDPSGREMRPKSV